MPSLKPIAGRMPGRFVPSAAIAAIAIVGMGESAAPRPPASAAQAVPSVDNVFWLVDCLLKDKDHDLEKVLSTVPGAKGSETPWILAAIGECLVEGRPIPAAQFYKRGAVAERLLYRDFTAIGSPARRRPAPLFAAVGKDYLARAEPHSVAALVMLDAASCLVRSDPARAFGFFRSGRNSAEESRLFSELAPALSGCLTDGQPLKLTPSIFRAFLAEAAYRVAAGKPEVFEVQP